MSKSFISFGRCIVLLTVLCGIILTVRASDVPVKYLGIEHGLSNNSVTCITQDRYGFVWLGSYDGLNRYDGYEFKTFRNIWGDQKSLPYNHIKCLLASNDRIYTGTEKGFCYFDYADGRFHPLYINRKHKQTRIDFNIETLILDKQQNVYACSAQGIMIFHKKDSVGENIIIPGLKGQGGVQGMTLDKKGRIWFVITNKGLAVYDPVLKKTELVSTKITSTSCLATDLQGGIWIGGSNGVYIFNPATRTIRAFEDKGRKLLASNISHLLLTAKNEMWISTNGSGISIWDERLKTLKHIKPGEEANVLRSGAISAVMEDTEGRRWIATLRGGVNIIDKKANYFKLFEHDALNRNSVPNNYIRSFCEDEQQNLWIGTDGAGLSYWNRKKNTFTNYSRSEKPGAVSSNYVVSIIKDFSHRIWVATFNGGIDEFDPSTGKFIHYTCKKAGSVTVEKNFWILFEDSKKRLWAGSTWGGALYLFNRSANNFELFDRRLTDIHTLFEDKAGTLWGGNYRHLIKIDPDHHKHQYFLVGQPIRAINEDAGKYLWIGTEGGGLLQFDRALGQMVRFTEKDGLPSNSVLNILSDEKNNLWCSTYNGLARFAVKTKKVANYFASDGLQSNQFMYNAALKLRSGKMVFGGIRGFNMFDPDSVSSLNHQPWLQLTDLKISNHPLSQTPYAKGQTINNLSHLEIPFDQATLSVAFTALEYSYPEKISYAYFLEGWDHDWNYVGKLKSAYFSRLNEGEYTLKIKATNTEGEWGAAPRTIKITVLPPWYRTWYTYLTCLFVVSGILYFVWIYRKRQIELTYEVQIANLKIEKEKESNEKKLSFFTNVSHEFRTPLTLIINPIKDLLNQSKGNNEELNIVYRNARRLLGLVDHLLLFRKTESENDRLKISYVNFIDLCKEVYTCFSHQAKIKNITYRIEHDVPEIMVYVDRAKIEIALFNLISNAIKFTPEGGSISLMISQDDASVYFRIHDNGIGIQAEVGEKLFEKYYQAKDKNSLKTGFGIGLYLVKTFLECHKGTITYESGKDAGTTFILSLPKGKLHFGERELIEIEEQQAGYYQELIDLDNNVDTVVAEDTSNLELLISNKQTILVIDDNKELRSYIRRILQADYTVYEAEDGTQGLEMIRKYLPDVIICDIVMPNLNGIELVRIVKNDSATSHIPVIILTGEPGTELKLQGIEEGAVDYINKPFDKELLLARIKGIIKNKTELQKYFYNEVTLKGNSLNISEEHKDFLYKCIEVIEGALTNQDFETNLVADRLGMSYSSLYKKIKAITGMSVNGFIRFVRLRKAAEIMINTNCHVNEAAFRVGYSDIKYFREHFNKQFGSNPSEFIKKHRNAFQHFSNVSHLVTKHN